MRATIEHHGADDDLPDVRVRVVRGHEDLSIKVRPFHSLSLSLLLSLSSFVYYVTVTYMPIC